MLVEENSADNGFLVWEPQSDKVQNMLAFKWFDIGACCHNASCQL